MSDNTGDAERAALEMVARFGGGAARIARGLAEAAEEQQRNTAQAWRDIADIVERLSPMRWSQDDRQQDR